MATVGLLPPGEMGAFLGRAVLASGHEVVLWVGAGPSDATRRRAAAFTEVADLDELAGRTDTVLSVCPPAYALDVGRRSRRPASAGVRRRQRDQPGYGASGRGLLLTARGPGS